MAIEFDARLSTVVDDNREREIVSRPAAGPLSPEMLARMHRYWSAANYLTIGQIYLQENPLLREPLQPDHIKKRLLGHWGTSSGLNFILTHLNRLIVEHDIDIVCIIGPGHGGPAGNAHAWLEGSYSEVYHSITQRSEERRVGK